MVCTPYEIKRDRKVEVRLTHNEKELLKHIAEVIENVSMSDFVRTIVFEYIKASYNNT